MTLTYVVSREHFSRIIRLVYRMLGTMNARKIGRNRRGCLQFQNYSWELLADDTVRMRFVWKRRRYPSWFVGINKARLTDNHEKLLRLIKKVRVRHEVHST